MKNRFPAYHAARMPVVKANPGIVENVNLNLESGDTRRIRYLRVRARSSLSIRPLLTSVRVERAAAYFIPLVYAAAGFRTRLVTRY